MYAILVAIIFLVLVTVLYARPDRRKIDNFQRKEPLSWLPIDEQIIKESIVQQEIDEEDNVGFRYTGPSNQFEDEMLNKVNFDDDPIISQTVVKKGDNIFQATIYANGNITFTKNVKLSPNELKNFIKLKKNMINENPHCCPDIPPDWVCDLFATLPEL